MRQACSLHWSLAQSNPTEQLGSTDGNTEFVVLRPFVPSFISQSLDSSGAGERIAEPPGQAEAALCGRGQCSGEGSKCGVLSATTASKQGAGAPDGKADLGPTAISTTGSLLQSGQLLPE